MGERRLGSLGPAEGPVVHLCRVGPFWRRRYEVRCDECGPVSCGPTSDIGWIRVRGHRVAHLVGWCAMPDARDTVRTWLAERHEAAWAGCYHEPNPCADCLADAILSAPGVQVESLDLALRDDGLLHLDLSPPTHTQVVIPLPAQPIQETP